MLKTLIFNPTKNDEGKYLLLVSDALVNDAINKSLRTTPEEFRPTVITESNLGRLIGVIEYKVKSVSNWVGREVNTYQEAKDYLCDVATQIYGPRWELKLLKNEVMWNKAKVFGIVCPDPELVQLICDQLKYVADVEVNAAEDKTNKTVNKDKQNRKDKKHD